MIRELLDKPDPQENARPYFQRVDQGYLCIIRKDEENKLQLWGLASTPKLAYQSLRRRERLLIRHLRTVCPSEKMK